MTEFGALRALTFDTLEWFTDEGFAVWLTAQIAGHGKSICDVGAGSCLMEPYYSRFFPKIIAVDPSLHMLLRAKHTGRASVGTALVRGVAEMLPLSNLSLDVAISKSSLHHFASPETGLKELARIARLLVGVVEVVAPSAECENFARAIVLRKEKGRKLLFSEETLSEMVRKVAAEVRTVLYDQYIDVARWLESSDLDHQEQRGIFEHVSSEAGEVRRHMQIHWRSGRLYMLRRMALVLGAEIRR